MQAKLQEEAAARKRLEEVAASQVRAGNSNNQQVKRVVDAGPGHLGEVSAHQPASPAISTEPQDQGEQFFTPEAGLRTTYTNPLANLEENMPAPNIPESAPQFRGEKGKDDLYDWISQAKWWFARTSLLNKGNNSISEADLVDIFCLTAFKTDTPARDWFEANRDALLATPSEGKAVHEHLLEAIQEHFGHMAADPDQELCDMQLLRSTDLSTFAHKFVKVHNASTISNDKAVKMLLIKCSNIKDLHARLVSIRIDKPKITVLEMAEHLHKHQAMLNEMECMDPTRTKKHTVALTMDDQDAPLASCTTQIARPPDAKPAQARAFFCMKHGQNNSHNTDQCRDLQAMLAGEKAPPPRSKPN